MLPLVHHGIPPCYSYNLEVNNYSNSSAGKVCIFNANVKIEKVMVGLEIKNAAHGDIT